MNKKVIISIDGLTKMIAVTDLTNVRLELGIYFNELVAKWEKLQEKNALLTDQSE